MSTQKRRARDEKHPGGQGSAWRTAWEWAKSIAFAILLFLIIRTFLIQAFKIPTGSMEDTLLVGDFLLVNKVVYGAHVPFTGSRLPGFDEPERGDIVVFKYPGDPRQDYVKRIVAVGGDTVEMRDKVLHINGEPQKEPYVRYNGGLERSGFDEPLRESFRWQLRYLVTGDSREVRESYRPTRDTWGPLVVPPGKYFVMGDNRDDSFDSRFWGFIDREAIRGQPLIIYFSKEEEAGILPMPWEIRLSRIGHIIQ